MVLGRPGRTVNVMRRRAAAGLLALAVACAAGAERKDADVEALIAAGVKPDASGIAKYLRQLLPNAQRDRRVAALIRQLGADSYAAREEAAKAISALPVLPRAALTRAAQSTDAEVRTRAQGLLGRGDRQAQRTIAAALAVIAKRKIKSLATEVIAAGPHCPAFERSRLLREALAATVAPADVDLLRRAVRAESALTRAAGAVALDHLLADKADADLAALLKDPADRVRLASARALANRGRPTALPAMAELLGSKEFWVRWQAAEALRWLSGMRFGYEAHGAPDKRKQSAEKWLAWSRGPGRQAKLRFPIPTTGVIQLFNGADLTGWRAVDGGKKVDPKTNWQVKDGVLRCNDTGRGYLYHTRSLAEFELTLEWRWPKRGGDSGVWLMIAKPGQAACLEAQLLAGSAGDFWVVGNFPVTVRGQRVHGRAAKLADSSERPLGQWNRMTIRIIAGTVSVHVNGVLQNQAANCPRAPAHIALQNEGTVIEFRNIQVRPLTGTSAPGKKDKAGG